ncbi:lysylphosphatidylglycerol synthase transmembrane domain-containing protein [Thiohalocapsa marina]|nr:lysylphosphatidylglycerol synthase transmembrane domain-containing protein [Thiohalocapsa marina]
MGLGRPRDWLIGGALLLGLVIAVQKGVGWRALLVPWTTLSPWVLFTAFALTALSYWLRAVRVYDFFGSLLRGRFSAVLRLSVLHNTANNLLPMRAGELLFPWLMRRYFGHGFLAAGASLLWIRLLDLHFLGLVGWLILWLRDPAWLWVLAALAWIVLLPVAGRLVLVFSRTSVSHGRLWRIASVIAGAGPAEPRSIGRLYLWTAAIWSLKLVAFAAVLGHFVAVDFWKVLAGVIGAELSTVLPFHGIAGAGSYELATVAAMLPFGISAADALGGAVNLHLFLLGTTLVLGGLALLIPIRTQIQTGSSAENGS